VWVCDREGREREKESCDRPASAFAWAWGPPVEPGHIIGVQLKVEHCLARGGGGCVT